ncbi:unnamed protein product [Caretta caretta]
MLAGSAFEKDTHLHRTKCRALINQVMAPCMFYNLIKDIGESQDSRMIDKSTDIVAAKQLCTVVRYFSPSLGKIVSIFLGLVSLEGKIAEAIATALLQFLVSVGLDFSRWIGIGIDGCSVMVGHKNSMYTHLLKKNDRLSLIKCVCHSIQLCAIEMLPRSLEFLVSHSYSWFSRSPQRQCAYAQLFQMMNLGNTPLKLVQLSVTRWLFMYDCFVCILDQRYALKLHFQLSKAKLCCYEAEVLYNMYCDPVNKLYLQFLTPILQEFSGINKLFQLESGGNAFKMLDTLLSFSFGVF